MGDPVNCMTSEEQLDFYNECIRISTVSSLQEMILPGVLAVFSPAIVGFILGAEALAGLLAGGLTSGFMLAVTMSNAGGAWDNAKKYVEKNGLGLGKGKKTKFHEAVVVGDTVGDPFKDTSGPALNILIKLMSIFSLVLAPVFKDCCTEEFESWGGVVAGVMALLAMAVFSFFVLRYIEKGNAEFYAMIEKMSEQRKNGTAAVEEEGKVVDASAVAPVVCASAVAPVVCESAAAPSKEGPPPAATAAEGVELQDVACE